MTDIFRISEAASLGLHAMALLAARSPDKLTTPAIAERLGASPHHLAKVMQRLVRAGLLGSTRGVGGGFHLLRPADRISLLEVYEAVEGTMEQRACLLGARPLCPKGRCLLGGLNVKLHRQARAYFQKAKLSDAQRAFTS
jgi:Rrf2 family protein